MNNQIMPFTDPMGGTLWSPARIDRELMLLRNCAFFHYNSYELVAGLMQVRGTIMSKEIETGRVQFLKVRIEYPRPYPRREPHVFDDEQRFIPSARGHQFKDYSLCLSFPERREFTLDSEVLSQEVLQASLIWLDKRHIFERTTKWPGEAEEHNWSGPYRELLTEEVRRCKSSSVSVWADWVIAELVAPNSEAGCPCLSGRPFVRCHLRLCWLTAQYLLYRVYEKELNERRPVIKAA
jgi:hypothetical protein